MADDQHVPPVMVWDEDADTITIDGTTYAREMFRFWSGRCPEHQEMRLHKHESGVIVLGLI